MTGASAAAVCPSRTRDAARCRHARNVDQVLDGDRHAVQWSAIAPLCQLAIRRRRIAARILGHHANECVEPWLKLVDAPQAGVGDFERGCLTRPKRATEFFDGEGIGNIGHCVDLRLAKKRRADESARHP